MRLLRLAVCVTMLAVPVLTDAQLQSSPDEFVPVSEIPPEEQIPAINLVAAAYGVVWIAVLGYVWSIGRRLEKAESEITRLERKAG